MAGGLIRPAVVEDMPAILGHLAALYAAREWPVAFDKSHTALRLIEAIRAPDWLVLVADEDGVVGVLIASASASMISPERIAVEHAWVGKGRGFELSAIYEAWAKDQGCAACHLSLAPHMERTALKLIDAGYAPAEIGYVKAL